MATTVLTSLLGFVFWRVTTGSAEASAVGTATAALALSGTAALLATQGIQPALLVRLGALDPLERRDVLLAAVWASGALSALAALAAALLLGRSVDSLAVLRSPLVTVLVMLTAAVLAIGGAVDAACLAAQRPRGVVLRNAVQSLGKVVVLVAALAAFSPVSDAGVAAAVLAASAVSGLVSVGGTVRWLHRGLPRGRTRWRQVPEQLRALSGLGLHHVAALAGQLPALVLPLVVAVRLGAEQSAYFAVTWMLAGVFFLISPAVATALLAAGAGPELLAARVRRAAQLVAALLTVPLAVALCAARPVLDLFGPGYGAAGAALLVALAVSCLPDAVTNLAVSVFRVQGRLRRVAVLNTAMSAGALALTWTLLPTWGIAAVGWSWFVAQTSGAAYVLVVWLRTRRRARPTPAAPVRGAHPRQEVLA